jgi:peptidoglycan hydrolase CwlO-like protein
MKKMLGRNSRKQADDGLDRLLKTQSSMSDMIEKLVANQNRMQRELGEMKAQLQLLSVITADFLGEIAALTGGKQLIADVLQRSGAATGAAAAQLDQIRQGAEERARQRAS